MDIGRKKGTGASVQSVLFVNGFEYLTVIDLATGWLFHQETAGAALVGLIYLYYWKGRTDPLQ